MAFGHIARSRQGPSGQTSARAQGTGALTQRDEGRITRIV
jgi:hypothetical protein